MEQESKEQWEERDVSPLSVLGRIDKDGWNWEKRVGNDRKKSRGLIWKCKEEPEGKTGCCFSPQGWKANSMRVRERPNLQHLCTV